MPTKVWYEPGKELYVVEFADDPIFDLPDWAVGKEQSWGAIWHHLLVTSVDNKLLYHRVGISLRNGVEEFARRNLNDHLLQIARSLRHMGLVSGEHHPEGYTSRQCLRAANILETEHGALLEGLIAANPSIC